ncbi:hypothetical protein [Streptomyces sp. NPDC056524]|uniref:hypothetical protein n=1 Tax=Streptomyces sp. NPDC056524 TaxID=3345851 RepID=UPI0036AD1BFE
MGKTSAVTALAASSSQATGRCVVSREVRQTAARPRSQTMYCGLITRLVTVNSRIAVSAASNGVASVHREARPRQSISQPKAAAVATSESWVTVATCAPTNSMAP